MNNLHVIARSKATWQSQETINDNNMKKIFFFLVALAALAACSKSEVEYTDNMELSFAPVSRLSTKAAVDGTDYPDALNMFVFANAGETTDAFPAGYDEPYFANAEFTHTQRTDIPLATDVFAGVPPYYWPNVKELIFSGYSKSGNVASMTPKPTYVWNTYVIDDGNVRKLAAGETVGSYTVSREAWEIEMQNYAPGNGTTASGDNDLMWFPTTTTSYAKPTTPGESVQVTMKHACAWVTIKIKGDATTGKTGTTWKIKNLSFTNLSQSGNVTLGTEADWTSIAAGADFDVFNLVAGKSLTTDYVDYTQIDYKDLVIVPQNTKTLYVTYEYVSQTGLNPITETKPLDLTYTGGTGWEAGKHYTYNITLGTSEILILPILTDWIDVPDADGTDKVI